MRYLLVFALLLSSGLTVANPDKTIYGYVEKVTLLDKNLMLRAKLDTGAKSASLNAVDISEIEVKGIPFLQFSVPTKEGLVVFQSEYIGRVKIKPRVGEPHHESQKHVPIRRPVVLMNIKLGDKVRAVLVNLTNRKRFNYPLLLGRDAINDFNGVIDPSQAFTIRNINEKQ